MGTTGLAGGSALRSSRTSAASLLTGTAAFLPTGAVGATLFLAGTAVSSLLAGTATGAFLLSGTTAPASLFAGTAAAASVLAGAAATSLLAGTAAASLLSGTAAAPLFAGTAAASLLAETAVTVSAALLSVVDVPSLLEDASEETAVVFGAVSVEIGVVVEAAELVAAVGVVDVAACSEAAVLSSLAGASFSDLSTLVRKIY